MYSVLRRFFLAFLKTNCRLASVAVAGLRNMKPHVLVIKLSYCAWAAYGLRRK